MVVVVVDQMRADYLWRWKAYWKYGFKRLLDGATIYDNVYHDHVPTFTAVGHATIFTGVPPSVHGIVANNWFDTRIKKKVYAVEDTVHKKVWGEPDGKGYSPHHLRVPTVGDLLKLRNPTSKVVSVSLKDRSAIISGGKTPDFAFWYDFMQGQWTTSSYYADDIPKWVKNYNQKAHAAYHIPEVWRLHPLLHGLRNKYDHSPYERSPFKDMPVFPYQIMDAISSYPGTVASTPWGNAITFDFAKTVLKSMKLGVDTIPDMLAISLSSTDIVGHYFGPRSLELMDVYIRLDSLLGDFLQFLDTQVGKNNYLFVLTSDHGVAENWKFSKEILKIDAGVLTQDSFAIWKEQLNRQLKQELGVSNVVLTIMNQWVYLDRQRLTDFQYFRAVHLVEQWLAEKQQVVNVWNRDEIKLKQAPQYLINGFDPERCGDVWFLLKPGWYEGYAETGTTHGTPYAYDQRVPVIIYGAGADRKIIHDKKSIRFVAQYLVDRFGLTALWERSVIE